MPGYEFFGEEERKEVNEVLETGILAVADEVELEINAEAIKEAPNK